MSITIIPVEDQAQGQFNGGEILENKPIGFPQDGGRGKPYSTLFYWAHAWSEKGSTIGEHPHQAFEIISYVIKGKIEHYDSKQKGWNILEEGSAQVIMAGNGITHAEKLHPGSEIFQIWLDPNIKKSIYQPATYTDYPPDLFQKKQVEKREEKNIAGLNGPMELETKEVEIKELWIEPGRHKIELLQNSVYSLFQLEGEAALLTEAGSVDMKKGDFAIIRRENHLILELKVGVNYFLLRSPEKPKYSTYIEKQ